MPILLATHASFAEGFRLSFADEVSGEAFFDALAKAEPDPHRSLAWQRLAEIEQVTTSALAGAAAELGLLPEDPVALRAQGIAEAEEWIGQGWQRSLEVMRDEFPVYLAEFDQILGMAPPAYAPLIQLLYDHEVAFIDFARAALAGQSDAIAVLDRYLEDHPAITT